MNRHELLELEDRLFDAFSSIVPCEGHAIYFPRDDKPKAPVWIPDEKRLIVPLITNDGLLGVLLCRNVTNPETMESLLPHLPAIANLCLRNIDAYRLARLDAQTSLFTRAVVMERINRDTEALRAVLNRADASRNPTNSFGGAGFGITVVHFAGIDELARTYGHSFSERMLGEQAKALKSILPGNALAARTGEYEFAFITDGGRMETTQNALTAIHRLGEVTLPAPHTGRIVKLVPYAGFALYPQNLDGGHHDDLAEPAAALLHRASLAAHTASSLPADERVMAFDDILRKGGRISRILPVSTVEITLGRNEDVREGMHFAVWQGVEEGGTSPTYKGELVITDVSDMTAVAEILCLGNERIPIAKGDALTLLSAGAANDTAKPSPDADTATLLRHGDFLAKLPALRNGLPSFALVMLRIPGSSTEEPLLPTALRISRENGNTATLVGRFASNTLIFFHPNGDAAALTGLYGAICRQLAELPGSAAECGAGIAVWPFLQYHPGDMTDCARKALEYALLLPAPHVGVFGSLAINISADKRHCRGDIFGAVEEYRIALLADPSNSLAWNSIGVCMESLGRTEEARMHFERAAQADPNDASIMYNLAGACLRLNDTTGARRYFEQCLELDPRHMYASIRLAQMNEEEGDAEKARKSYLSLAAAFPKAAAPYRCLARLAMKAKTAEKAREYLHKALQRDPRDAEALTMMARMYLDGGEDAELAEYLARQSLAIRPDRKAGWTVLAKALEARGLTKEARDAWLRAEEL